MTIVQRLEKYLEEGNISLSKFTEWTGIPSDRARQWLRGKGNPKTEDERKIEEFLDGKRQLSATIGSSSSYDIAIRALQDQVAMQKEIIRELEMRLSEEKIKSSFEFEHVKAEILSQIKQWISSGDFQKTTENPLPKKRVSRFEEQPSVGRSEVPNPATAQGSTRLKGK